MSAYTFNKFDGTDGATIARDLMVCFINTGTSNSPTWSPLGKRVEDSSIEFDWDTESRKDILGNTYNTGKKAVRTETFEGMLEVGDAALEHIWELAVIDDDISALLNQDCLIVHLYADDSTTTPLHFAERYSACAVLPSSIGGEGGAQLEMSFDVTFGGTRTKGSATYTSGVCTFTADT